MNTERTGPSNKEMIVLNAQGMVRFFYLVAVLLLIAHVWAMLMTYKFGHEFVFGLVPLFNFTLEKNAPTYFSTLLLLINGGLFYIVWRSVGTTEPFRVIWLILSLVFCFLSVDEFAGLHELLVHPVRKLTGATGMLYFAWVIPYGAAVLLLGAVTIPAIWRLGPRYFIPLMLSAVIYVGGAIGVEMLESAYGERVAYGDLNYRILSSIQETLEIIGLLLLFRTLLFLIESRFAGFTIVMKRGSSAR